MIALLLLLLLTSCSMSELVAIPEPRTKVDTTAYTPRHRDTTEISGVPVTFDVSVEDWKE